LFLTELHPEGNIEMASILAFDSHAAAKVVQVERNAKSLFNLYCRNAAYLI